MPRGQVVRARRATVLSGWVSLAQSQVRLTLVGALRDLQGIVSACANRRTYAMFFEWIYPAFTPVLQLAARAPFATPDVSIPLLKLYAELVYNKGQVEGLMIDTSISCDIIVAWTFLATLTARGSVSRSTLRRQTASCCSARRPPS